MLPRIEICYCSICGESGDMICEGDDIAEHFVYSFDGELDYIELAHRSCAISDQQVSSGYWSYDLEGLK